MLQLLLLLAFSSLATSDLITVDTSRGAVQGFDHDFGDDKTQTFYGYGQMFLGIPYTNAPLGAKRFTLPEDICQYNDKGEVHNATYYRPRCWQVKDGLQPAYDMDEDCLYLNVYSPNVTGFYPVMFYIPGGGFTTGGGDVYHWKGAVRNLVSRGVVVVTINYRVGVIGFFTTFSEAFPPNRGMFDMMMALRWVNEEIHNFGGDNSRITIHGQSAGATAVSHLSLSPMAQGLFHQLIQNSGTALMEIETPEPARGSINRNRAQQLCNITIGAWGSAEIDDELMECLVNATPEELISFDMSPGPWAPALDGYFIPDYPENLAKTRKHYPLIAIDMMEEAAAPYPYSALALPFTGPETVNTSMHAVFNTQDPAAVNELADYAVFSYTNGNPPADKDHMGWLKVVTDVMTGMGFDALFVRDVKWQIEYGNKNVWLFTLAHRSNLPFYIQLGDWIPVAHCADLPYLWFYADIWETYNATEADFATAEHFGRIWTDFAKNGKLSYDAAGNDRNYIDIDEELVARRMWRATTDDVFNVKGLQLLGNLPNLTIPQDSWDMLNALGAKIKTKWEGGRCHSLEADTTTKSVPDVDSSTKSTAAPTTSTSDSITLSIASFIIVLSCLLRWE